MTVFYILTIKNNTQSMQIFRISYLKDIHYFSLEVWTLHTWGTKILKFLPFASNCSIILKIDIPLSFGWSEMYFHMILYLLRLYVSYNICIMHSFTLTITKRTISVFYYTRCWLYKYKQIIIISTISLLVYYIIPSFLLPV